MTSYSVIDDPDAIFELLVDYVGLINFSIAYDELLTHFSRFQGWGDEAQELYFANEIADAGFGDELPRPVEDDEVLMVTNFPIQGEKQISYITLWDLYVMLHSNFNINYEAICNTDFVLTITRNYDKYLERLLQHLRKVYHLPEDVLEDVIREEW